MLPITDERVLELARRSMAPRMLPDDDVPLSDADDIAEKIGKRVDLIIDSGHCEPESTTVLDLTEDEIVVVREGKGDLSRVM